MDGNKSLADCSYFELDEELDEILKVTEGDVVPTLMTNQQQRIFDIHRRKRELEKAAIETEKLRIANDTIDLGGQTIHDDQADDDGVKVDDGIDNQSPVKQQRNFSLITEPEYWNVPSNKHRSTLAKTRPSVPFNFNIIRPLQQGQGLASASGIRVPNPGQNGSQQGPQARNVTFRPGNQRPTQHECIAATKNMTSLSAASDFSDWADQFDSMAGMFAWSDGEAGLFAMTRVEAGLLRRAVQSLNGQDPFHIGWIEVKRRLEILFGGVMTTEMHMMAAALITQDGKSLEQYFLQKEAALRRFEGSWPDHMFIAKLIEGMNKGLMNELERAFPCKLLSLSLSEFKAEALARQFQFQNRTRNKAAQMQNVMIYNQTIPVQNGGRMMGVPGTPSPTYRGRGSGRGITRGRGRGYGPSTRARGRGGGQPRFSRCFYCGKYNHEEKNCWALKRLIAEDAEWRSEHSTSVAGLLVPRRGTEGSPQWQPQSHLM